MDTFEEVRRRGQPYWWLSASRCTACGQAWLVGAEERVNDLYCLRRLAGSELRAIEGQDRWPEDFDRYERLIRIGRNAGRNFQFIDPLNSSLGDTLTDLARARPGIKVSELAALLNLYYDEAVELARRAVAEADVTVTFDT